MGTESVRGSAPNFQTPPAPRALRTCGVTSSPNQDALAQGLNSLFSQGGLHLLSLANSVDIINKENQADAKHRKTNFFHSPLLKRPHSKILKTPSFEKCGRVVETGPKTNGKQPVWISSAHTVAPSVPTPARSSREWERFRCSRGQEERD